MAYTKTVPTEHDGGSAVIDSAKMAEALALLASAGITPDMFVAGKRAAERRLTTIERSELSWNTATDDLNAVADDILSFPDDDIRMVPLSVRSRVTALGDADYRPNVRITINDMRGTIELSLDRLSALVEITNGIDKSAARLQRLNVKTFNMLISNGMYGDHPEFTSALKRAHLAIRAWSEQGKNRALLQEARELRDTQFADGVA